MVNTVVFWHTKGFMLGRFIFASGSSISELGQLFSELLEVVVTSSLLSLLKKIELSLVESGASLLSLFFDGFDDLLLFPADLGAQITQNAVGSEALQSEDLEGLGNNLSLFHVVGGGDTFEAFHSGKSSSTSLCLVGKHTSDGSPEDSGGSSVMGVTSSGVVGHSLSEEFMEFQLISVEGTGDDELFTSNEDDSLSVKELLSND